MSIEEGLRERFSIQIGDEMRSTCWAASSPRASPASATWIGATFAPAGSCSCSGPVRSTTRRTPTSPPFAGTETTAARARACRRRSSPVIRTSRSSICREVLDTIKTIVDNVTLAVTVVGGAGAPQRQPDSDRRRVDDEVPARLRGGHPEDAWRQQPADCDDAAARIRRARRDCRHRRGARRRSL